MTASTRRAHPVLEAHSPIRSATIWRGAVAGHPQGGIQGPGRLVPVDPGEDVFPLAVDPELVDAALEALGGGARWLLMAGDLHDV